MKETPPKGTRVRLGKLVHPNQERPWSFRIEVGEGHGGSIVHGPFKGDWYLLALDCEPAEIGRYSRFAAVTLDEMELR